MTGTRYRSLQQRFEDFTIPEPNSGCYLWLGASHHQGYGLFNPGKSKGGIVRAHRWAWEHANGPIPAGKMVCHHCDVPSCVNPDHLFLGNAKTNRDDCNAKDRHARGERHHMVKFGAAEIYAIRADPRPQYVIADENGVSRSLIRTIKTRKTWRHLP